MPIPKAFEAVVNRLTIATESRALNWTEGPADLTYSTSLNTYSFRVSSTRTQAQQAVSLHLIPVSFRALDAKGKVIDEFVTQPNEGKQFHMLYRLFERARELALKIDDETAKMIEELEQYMPPKLDAKSVLSASWGEGEKQTDVTEKLRLLLQSPTIETATIEKLGDPSQGRYKFLKVTYLDGGSEKTATINENAPIDIYLTNSRTPTPANDPGASRLKEWISSATRAIVHVRLATAQGPQKDASFIHGKSEIKLTYEIESDIDMAEGIWLGASIHDAKNQLFNVVREDKPVAIQKGHHSYTRTLTVRDDVPPGPCVLGWGIWYGKCGDSQWSLPLPGRQHQQIKVT